MDACDRDRNQDKQFEQIFALIKKKILSNVTLHCSFEQQTRPKTLLRNIIPIFNSVVQKPPNTTPKSLGYHYHYGPSIYIQK